MEAGADARESRAAAIPAARGSSLPAAAGVALLAACAVACAACAISPSYPVASQAAPTTSEPPPPEAEPEAMPPQPIHEAEETRRAEVLGARLIRPLGRDAHSSAELGSFVCDVLLDHHPTARICLLPGDALRADLPTGRPTYGHLQDALPGEHRPVILDVSGAILLEMLRIGTSGSGAVVQVAGVRVTYDRAVEACPTVDRDGDGVVDRSDRQRIVRATLVDGSPIEARASYRVITSARVTSGDHPMVAALATLHPTRVRTPEGALPIRDEVAAWLRRHRPMVNSPDRPVLDDARVTAIGEPPGTPCP